MTYNEARNLLIERLTRVGNNRITGPDVLESALTLLDFSSAIDNADILPLWTNALTFNADGTGAGAYCRHPDNTGKIRIFESKINNNINIAPPTDPAVIETASWREQSPSVGSSIKEWTAGIYGSGLQIVYHNHSVFGRCLYILLQAQRPFNSTNIESEIIAGIWAEFPNNNPCKQIVKVAAQSNVALGGLQTIDGIVCVAGDRVFTPFQSLSTERLVWVVQPGAWTLPEDGNNLNKLIGAIIQIQFGTYAGRIFRQTNGALIPFVNTPTWQELAFLDANRRIPAELLPSYVDDVLEFANLAAFPGAGEAGKIYVATDTNLSYRWSGSAYILISSAPADATEIVKGIAELANQAESETAADATLGNRDHTRSLTARGFRWAFDAVWAFVRTQSQTFTANIIARQFASNTITLADAATIEWNGNDGQNARVTLAGNRTLGAISNPVDGAIYTLRVIQDATGGRTLAFNAAYIFPDSVPPSINPRTNQWTVLRFLWNGVNFIYLDQTFNVHGAVPASNITAQISGSAVTISCAGRRETEVFLHTNSNLNVSWSGLNEGGIIYLRIERSATNQIQLNFNGSNNADCFMDGSAQQIASGSPLLLSGHNGAVGINRRHYRLSIEAVRDINNNKIIFLIRVSDTGSINVAA